MKNKPASPRTMLSLKHALAVAHDNLHLLAIRLGMKLTEPQPLTIIEEGSHDESNEKKDRSGN
jgi:hypothetical protein